MEGFAGDPMAVAWGANHDFLNVFVRGTDGAAWHKWWDGGAWQPPGSQWQSLGGKFVGNPAPVAWGESWEKLNVFALGVDGAIWHKWSYGGDWAPPGETWETLGGNFAGGPAAVTWGSNREKLNIFVRGTDGAVWHKWWDGANWGPSPTDWELLGGVAVDRPEAVAWTAERAWLNVFARDRDGTIRHKWWDGGNWQA